MQAPEHDLPDLIQRTQSIRADLARHRARLERGETKITEALRIAYERGLKEGTRHE